MVNRRLAATCVALVCATSTIRCESFSSSANDATLADASSDAAAASDGSPAVDAGASRYAAAVLEDRPVAYFRFGGPADSATKDEISGRRAMVVGTVAFGVAGAIAGDDDTAATFDDGYVSFGDVFDFAGVVAFSVEAWIKPSTAPVEYWEIVDKAVENTALPNDLGWALGTVESEGRGTFFTRSNDAGRGFLASEKVPVVGVFTHAVATSDGLNVRIYIDGVQQNIFGYGGVVLPDTSADLRIGRGGNSASAFRGVIDEVAIYDQALPATRVQAHYDAARAK
jgi:hypothetical protein